MWQRGILVADSQNYSAADEELLARMHLAEGSGAVGFCAPSGRSAAS